MKQNFVYRHPIIYTLYLRCSLPLRQLSKRMKLISRIAGKNKTILDVACGPAHLYDYLDNTNHYSGFDLNKKFIDYAIKKYKLNLKIGDATDSKAYKKSDVVILLDILHHLTDIKRKVTINNSFSNAIEKVIICEPYVPDFFKKKGLLVRFAKMVFEYFERDGYNKVTIDIGLYKEQLRRALLNHFGAKVNGWKLEIVESTGYLIGIYTK
ncbi:MAG: class I SAM-dependent methyltransferase [Nanoarchaeota archaeon]|nr:class I SAM-dependent methyltransferase [Nanoarchaeota archaeon]